MRRNSAGRRGGPNVSGGPLITEHLKDLDLELELLKRKREMIEQQHHLYSSPQYGSQSQYESPPYNQRQYDSNRDFSHMYDGPSYGQHSRKRQADPWEYDLTNMFPNKKKPVQSIFGSRLGPKPGPPGPSNVGHAPARYQRPQPSAAYSPRPFKSSPTFTAVNTPPSQKFNKKPLLKSPSGLSKVSKPKPATAPNNLASKSVAERVNLVAEATKSSDAVDESLILREDGTPSRQMTGRLELTLGVLMKEIRDRYWSQPDYAVLFKTGHIQRVMKQAIRERIKVVMLGKVVGSNADIKRQYREEYPEDTDIDILNIALGAAGMPLAVKPDRTQVKPGDEDLRNKIYELMDARLDAMFTKLKEIYAEELQEKTGEESKQTDVAVEGSEGHVKGGVGGEAQRTSVAMVRRCLPRILRRYHRNIIELMNADALYVSAREAVAAAKQTGVEAGSQDDEATPVRQQSLNTLPYYIKIRAKPMLPKKKIMREFLAGFNTKTIKKHKTIHNLLFVGFSDKSDHDNMLAASGTVIGQSTLEITPSEKAAPRSNQEDNTSLEISPELDCQITDLLTSIRKAEEEDQDNGEGSCEKMDISEDNQSKGEVTDENGCAVKDEVIAQKDEADKDGSIEANAVLEKPEASTQDNKIQPDIKTEIVDPTESVPMEEAEVPQATQEPEKVTLAKVAATTAKVAATPAKFAATPANVAATPANLVSTSAKFVSTPAKAAETPTKVTAPPSKVAATPAKVAQAAAKVAESPAKVAATPAKVAATPAQVAATPAKAAATTAKVAGTPAQVAATPAKVAAIPAKVAATPATTPAKVAATPAKVASTPAKVAPTTAKVAATPATTPAKVAVTPAKVAATPATTPANATVTPAKVAATPATAPAKVAATPSTTPAKVAATPAKVAETPAKVAATPAKVAETPAKVAETPAKVAETTAKVAETPAKVAETAAKVPDSADKVAEPSKNGAENPDTESEKSDTVAELKSDAKETGRSTPTRMTRSANVTPSTIRTRRASRLAQNQ